MGLLQMAYETYENHSRYVGINSAEVKEPLAPVAHIVTTAQLTVTINSKGQFQGADVVDKKEPKIIIPATEESSGRTSKKAAHPLCDNLGYVAPGNDEKHKLYIKQLTEWAESEYSHPMLAPILSYVKGGTILSDLERAGIKKHAEKDTVRWVVIGLPDDDGGACWTNKSLFDAFTKYYLSKKAQGEQILCMVTGKQDAIAQGHIKGVVPINGNAKLISSNDKKNFTFRGRFTNEEQALTVGYEASQKAHNALKWLVASQGVQINKQSLSSEGKSTETTEAREKPRHPAGSSSADINGRTFLCWNPKGKKLPALMNPLSEGCAPQAASPSDYKRELERVLKGYRNDFDHSDCAVLAIFDAATTGRLAVTYYNEIQIDAFLEKLKEWDASCAWVRKNRGIQSPSLKEIVKCTFGTPRGKNLEVQDEIRKQQMQRLFICRIEGRRMPFDIMQAIFYRTMQPLAYEKESRELLNSTACAVIRKYYIDWKQEEYKMVLEMDKHDISYQYGRLLAVMEKAERDTYDKDEKREPNATRLQSTFCVRPAEISRRVIEQLKQAYYHKLPLWRRKDYECLIGEIYEKITAHPESEWNAPLKESYIMGYYLQKNALYSKNTNTEEQENDDSEE